MSWIVDRAAWYFSLGRPRKITSAIDSADEERSLNYIFHDPALEAIPRSLISVLGTMPDNLVDILDTAVQACRANAEFPVVVLSELRLDLIAARSAPVEFIPTCLHLPSVPAENYGRYVRQRWSLIMAKWDISNEIVLSSSIDEFLASQIGADIIQQLTCEQSRHAKDGQREC
ncbi:hypothetical protein [Sinorhizobium americanum]|uniref:Uncharacterized protein n=1 Tax=Sinorhizobium americanum TaxID=194963 RepID=A0A4R2C5H1_9HYPH|nr:hypothetical protein [Sinorhizobium americanum]TCN34089.1 hypothetical protein EV184_102400 [Sinorhizobium americanum]